jgi:hypothetical protein
MGDGGGSSWAADLQAYERERRDLRPSTASALRARKSRSLHLASSPTELASTATQIAWINQAKDTQMQRERRDYNILSGVDLRAGMRTRDAAASASATGPRGAHMHARTFDILVRERSTLDDWHLVALNIDAACAVKRENFN